MKLLLKLTFMAFLVVASCMLFVACESQHTHSFGEWKVMQEANCTEEGTEHRVCECGEEETRSIAINGEHDFTYGFCQYCQESTEEVMQAFESILKNECYDYWQSKYEISNENIEIKELFYDSVTPNPQGSVELEGRIMVHYNGLNYAGTFNYTFEWKADKNCYEIGVGVLGGYFGCTASGEVGTTKFSDDYEFTHMEAAGNAKSVLELYADGTIRHVNYGSTGIITSTTNYTYEISVAPDYWHITITSIYGGTQTMIYHVETMCTCEQNNRTYDTPKPPHPTLDAAIFLLSVKSDSSFIFVAINIHFIHIVIVKFKFENVAEFFIA